ncbi:dephospho-CoA kinase [Bacillaceae bacterium Marseille-Q3522]|nr:dephospho-CoA kinase [Bacillaceae bacterium Marseille-Q3522]
MSIVVGLTGGIASGKSTIAAMLKEIGIRVIDADVEARRVVEKGTASYRQIVNHFGEKILLDTGEINREKLGAIIFHHKQEREKLNRIVHPAVRKNMLAQKNEGVRRGEKLIVMDIPLLFESNLTHMVDKILLVYVTKAVQLQRLMERNRLSHEEALARIASQIPLEQKKERADAIIDNTGTIEVSKKQLLDILRDWN